MLTAVSAASSGSNQSRPVAATSATPTSTPVEVTTSANRCRASASSAGEPRLPAAARQHHRPGGVGGGGHGRDREAEHRLFRRARRLPAPPGLVQDEHRRQHDQRALQHGGEVLRLGVAVGVVGVRRHGGVADGRQGRERGGDVHHAFQRVGEQRHAARQAPGEQLQHQHRGGHGRRCRGRWSRRGSGSVFAERRQAPRHGLPEFRRRWRAARFLAPVRPGGGNPRRPDRCGRQHARRGHTRRHAHEEPAAAAKGNARKASVAAAVRRWFQAVQGSAKPRQTSAADLRRGRTRLPARCSRGCWRRR